MTGKIPGNGEIIGLQGPDRIIRIAPLKLGNKISFFVKFGPGQFRQAVNPVNIFSMISFFPDGIEPFNIRICIHILPGVNTDIRLKAHADQMV